MKDLVNNKIRKLQEHVMQLNTLMGSLRGGMLSLSVDLYNLSSANGQAIDDIFEPIVELKE